MYTYSILRNIPIPRELNKYLQRVFLNFFFNKNKYINGLLRNQISCSLYLVVLSKIPSQTGNETS